MTQSDPSDSMPRRDLLRAGLLGAAAVVTGGVASGAAGTAARSSAARLRVAFLTDAHLTAPTGGAGEPNARIAAAFDRVDGFKPDLIVFGGDNVMAVDNGSTAEAAAAQFENWKKLLRERVRVPALHVIGNHDIWRGEHAASHALGGKAYAVEAFGMPARYFAHDVGAWRFVMLDAYHDDGCYVDPEQYAWLEAQIAAAPGPVCVVSHASVVNSGHILESTTPGRVDGYNSPSGWVLGNAADVARLFARAGNVRVCLSGHMHQVDRIDLLGTAHVCGGAVSGAWWGGDYLEFFPCNLMLLELDDRGLASLVNVEYEGPAAALRQASRTPADARTE